MFIKTRAQNGSNGMRSIFLPLTQTAQLCCKKGCFLHNLYNKKYRLIS